MDLVGLIPSFGNILYTVAAFIVALSVIVAIHEYGHYIVGRWSGIHSEVFSIGFGPVLFSRTDRRGTVWQVAAVPLGGFVKFRGDGSAASAPSEEGIEHLGEEERRTTLHGAPLWARAATVAAGPFFNFILSIIVFAGILFSSGTARAPMTVEELTPLPYAPVELQQGDRILEIAGMEAPDPAEFANFVLELPQEPFLDYRVLRNGQEIVVTAPFPMPAWIAGLQFQSAASDIDLAVGDVITAVDGEAIFAFEQLRERVGASDGRVLELDVWRDGEELTFALAPRRVDLPLEDGGFETRWLIGVTGDEFFSPARETPGVGEALAFGVENTAYIIRSSVSALYHVAVGAISTCNLRGPLSIAETSGEAARAGVTNFIWLIAALSAAVGFLNLLPVPVLDGGHLLFHAYEAVTGRPPSDRALKLIMSLGLAILLSFMGFALFNDFRCP